MNANETIRQTVTVAEDAVERINEALKFSDHGERTNARENLVVAKLRLKVALANVDSAIRELAADVKSNETPNLFPLKEEKKKGIKARIEGDVGGTTEAVAVTNGRSNRGRGKRKAVKS